MKLSKFSFFLLVLLIISVFFNVNLVLSAESAEPGSAGDPLISKSYVDSEIAKLKALINQAPNGGSTGATTPGSQSGNPGGSSSDGFKVVELKKGQTLLSGNGTEIILRSGNATSIKGTYGGLADTTAAKDVNHGEAVERNHLLISSRNDGRGLTANSMCYLLVRGEYTIYSGSTSGSPSYSNSGNNNNNGNNSDNNAEREIGQGTPSDTSGVVNASALNIREKASTSSTIIGKVYRGETVTIISRQNDWYNIRTKDGITGWVSAQYIDVK